MEGIKSIINNPKKSSKTIISINIDDQEVTNTFEIAHSFKKIFCTVAQKIEDKITHTNTKYQDFLDNAALQTFLLPLPS